MKECRTCENKKELSEYHKHNNSYRLDCKICFRSKERERRVKRLLKKDPEHGKRVLEHQEKIRLRGKQPIGHSWCYECENYLTDDNFSNYALNNHGSCRECSNNKDIQRNRELKLKAIDYLGGDCNRCGFKGIYSAYDFHHIIPSEKEFSWTELRKLSFDKIKYELDKCICLCSNCHGLIHTKLNNNGTLNPEYVATNS